ncbi:MAG: aminoacyl-tRNA hydrolase [Pseudomonadota bacterium]
MTLQLIVGLGNPGDRYQGTRHNAGADFVTAVAAQYGARLAVESRFFGEAARVQTSTLDLRLLIPTTFMNHSGQSVSAMATFFKIPAEAILIAHDELDFEPGVARLKRGGGHGGHNGLRDISKPLGENTMRLRLGIGHPGHARDVSDYVLARPSQTDRQRIDDGIVEALRVLPGLAAGEWNHAVQQLHSATPSNPANNEED